MTLQRNTKLLLSVSLILALALQPTFTMSVNASQENRDKQNEGLVGSLIDQKAVPKIPEHAKGKIPDHYIVVLKDDVKDSKAVAASMAKGSGLKVGLTYSHALKGFSAAIPEHALEKINKDPRVKFIEQDTVVHAFNPGLNFQLIAPSFHVPVGQTIPTGVDRIDADLTTAGTIDGYKVDSDIAIIDTGIDRNHPDLNVVRGVTCFGAGFPGGHDDNGHGTHVAGTAAALDNDIGVVGVAPGAKLWAVKVLNLFGSGSLSCVIAGVDFVTANSDEIEVANMSLGGKFTSQALDEAISNSVNAGVTYAVAAGNSGEDASNFSPANHPDVITVSAIADSDGMCGSLGASTSTGDEDDTFASFSNFGGPVDIAAPGVDIRSTFSSGTYVTLSGTSMATPHVSGAAALLLEQPQNNGLSPFEIKSILTQAGIQQTKACDINMSNGDGGFTGDVDGITEPMLYAANLH